MCAGVGSPGTLREVLRGYTGDRSAAQIFDDEEWVEAFPLPRFRGALFRQAGGAGFQRCLLYTSPSPRDYAASRMPSSA